MNRLASVLGRSLPLAGLAVLVCSNVAQAALSDSKGTGQAQAGTIWLYFAAFVLGTLGVAFMPSKRKEAED